MKKSLALLNVIFIAGIILSSYLLYTGVAPIIQGKVRVEMQDENEIDWSFTNHTIKADTYVKIINGGNYDITDISLRVWAIENISKYPIFNISDKISRVVSGTTYTEPIHLSVSMDSIPENLKSRLINESTNFTVRGEISAYSINGLGEIKVHYRSAIQWEALLKKIEIDTANANVDYYGGFLRLSIPYEVETSSLLSGNADAAIRIYNGSQVLSNTTDSVPLGQDYLGYLRFDISESDSYYLMTHSMEIPIEAEITSQSGMRFTYSAVYDWGAPFDGLVMGNLYSDLNTAYVDYSFTNNYTRELDISLQITAYDSGGSVVGTSGDSFTAPAGAYIARTASVSVSGYPSYAIVRVTENISGWSYELRRDA